MDEFEYMAYIEEVYQRMIEDLLYDDEEWATEMALEGEDALGEWDLRPIFVECKLNWAWN